MQSQQRADTRYVTVSPDTWSLIRGAYLSGLSARTVAGRFGVSEGALRKRAAREGWTKRAFAARATPWPGAPERPEFTLDEVYAQEARLAALYPGNNNVRARIRQQLQVLRDRGWLAFGERRGTYRLTL